MSTLATNSVLADDAFFYVGTFTGAGTRHTGSKGIYSCKLNLTTGELSPFEVAAEVNNPAFLAWSPDRKHLYAVDEVNETDGKPGGGVNAFAVDGGSGKLTWLNHASSGGAGPCHIAVDPGGRTVLVANYGGGSLAALPILPNGHAGEPTSFFQHEGKSIDPARQDKPYVHSAGFSPDGKLAFVDDLGLDRLFIYDVSPMPGKISPHEPPYVNIKAGSGPRHFAMHPDGKHAYVISEMGSLITVLDFDAAKGTLTQKQTISTLPADFKGTSTCAEIQVHPSGRFVYGSNRGHDSIAVFKVNAADGTLEMVETVSTRGKTPRSFSLDPSGRWLIAANQDTASMAVFKVDAGTGRLTPAGEPAKLIAPVCVLFR